MFDATQRNGTMSLSKSPRHWAVYGLKISMKPKAIGVGAISDCGLKSDLFFDEPAFPPRGSENICGDEAGLEK